MVQRRAGQMDREESQRVRSIVPDDAINELRRVRAGYPLFYKEMHAYKKMVEEDNEIEESYKMFLSSIFNMDEFFEPQELHDKDNVNEQDGDSDCEEENEGERVILECRQDSGWDVGCNPGPRRKRGRPKKQKVDLSSQMPDVENRLINAPRVITRMTRSSRNLANEVEAENVKGSPDVVLVSHKRKLTRVAKPNEGPSNQTCDVENRRLTRSCRKLMKEIEAENVKGSLDILLVSHRRELNRVAETKMRASNQTSDVENHHEHDLQSNSVKKTNLLNKRKSTKEADRMENTKTLPNEMVPDLQYRHLNQNFELEDDHCGYMHKDKEFEPEPRRQVNVDEKEKVGPSNQMPDVMKKRKHDQLSCSLKETKCLATRKVTFEVDKVYNDKEEHNGMMLDSYKNCNSGVRRAMKQKVGPLDQVPDIQKKQKDDQPSCTCKKTNRKVELENDKGYSMKGTPNDMVLNSNKEFDLQNRRKVDKATKQNIGPSNQKPAGENKNKCLTQRILMDEINAEDIEDYSPNDLSSYPEFYDSDDDHGDYIHKGNSCGPNDVAKECKDDSDSDLEILDSEAIFKGGIFSTFVPSKRVHDTTEKCKSSKNTEFRKQVFDVLRKPFDKEEYVRHQEAAKCYLDQYPDLRRQLAKYRYKKGKRLNIYRGFFFWLQNLTQEGSFRPWTDGECLAMEPRSS